MTVLVLDIGSSSARALLYNDAAQIVPGALVQHKYQMETSPPGAATLDAAILRRVVETCVDEILSHPAAVGIRAVGMATFVGNVLGVDGDGQPITPIYLYADTRCDADVELLRDSVDPAAVHQRTGCRLHTAYHPARLHWLARTEPALFERVRLWTDFAGYLYHHWLGENACSYSVASWSGLLNRAALTWDTEWLSLLPGVTAAALPPLADYDHALAGLRPDYASRWPALRDVPFCLAIGDGAAANVGSGCVTPSAIALSLGTTGALRISLPAQNVVPPVPSGLWSYRITRNLHLLGGATSEGGNLYRWARETLQLPADFLDTVADQPIDGHGLTVLPLLAGERSPGWAGDATGAIHGLRLSTSPLDIAQAMLESLAIRLSLVYAQVRECAPEDAVIIASGGALSPYLAQLIADAFNRPVQVTANTEITSRGVALLTLRAAGIHLPLDSPPDVAYTEQPRPHAVQQMQIARARQQRLYQQVIGESLSPD